MNLSQARLLCSFVLLLSIHVRVRKKYLDSAATEGPKVCVCLGSATLHWLIYAIIIFKFAFRGTEVVI